VSVENSLPIWKATVGDTIRPQSMGEAVMSEPNRNDLQPCVVCGRWFIRRPDRVCSMTCASKLKAEENNLPSGSLMDRPK
jgi:hypothetical protein